MTDIAHHDMTYGDHHIKGTEYIGYDEDRQAITTMFFSIDGNKLAYTWDLDGDAFTNWFGEKGSDNFFTGSFGPNGDTVSGAWQWPNLDGTTGGYSAHMTRRRWADSLKLRRRRGTLSVREHAAGVAVSFTPRGRPGLRCSSF